MWEAFVWIETYRDYKALGRPGGNWTCKPLKQNARLLGGFDQTGSHNLGLEISVLDRNASLFRILICAQGRKSFSGSCR